MDFSFHIEDGGRIVAGIVAESTMDTLEIAFLFVDEAYRGRGLGKQLLLHVEDEAKRKGMRRVLLNTYKYVQLPGAGLLSCDGVRGAAVHRSLLRKVQSAFLLEDAILAGHVLSQFLYDLCNHVR